MRHASRVTQLLAVMLFLAPSVATANDAMLMRLFGDLTMKRSRARSDNIRASGDAARAMAHANMTNAQATSELQRARQLSIDADRNAALLKQMERDRRLFNREDLQARKKMEYLDEKREHLASFFSGHVTPANTRAFRWSLTRVPYAESFRTFLGKPVTQISGDQFTSNLPVFEVLMPTGDLRRPPLSLVGRSGTELYTSRREFAAIWQRLLTALRYDRELDYDHLVAVEQRMDRWRDCCLEREVSRRAQRDGRAYLDRLQSVVHRLETQQGLERLARLVKNEGFGFQGGTCGQLLQHIQDWSLRVEPGTEAQLLLGEYGEACLASIAEEIGRTQQVIKPIEISKK